MKKFYLFFALFNLFVSGLFVFAQTTNETAVESDTSVQDSSVQNTDSVNIFYEQEDISPSKVDANGNLTIRAGEEYESAINLTRGNLIIKNGAVVFNNIYLGSGNAVLEDNSEVKGNIIIKNGSLKIGNGVKVYGDISTYSLSAFDNIDITGSVDVTSANSIIKVGNNFGIGKTLTSKSSLAIGANGEINLFLSGFSAEVDGKVYKLGGKILSMGTNTVVRLPFVPVLKNADGSEVKTMANVSNILTKEDNSVDIAKDESLEDEYSSTDVIDDQEEYEGDDNFYKGTSTLPDVNNIINVDDINSYINKIYEIDSNISNLHMSGENVEINYKTPTKLFGFIQASTPVNIKVSQDSNVKVSYPWYSFVFRISFNEKTISDSVDASIKSIFDLNTVTTDGLSPKLQASITNNILWGLKGLLER